MNKKQIGGSIAVLASLVLTACGGGGGGDSGTSTAANNTTTTTTVSSAEGVYEGTISNGKSHQTLILDNGQYYTLYGQKSGGILYVYGMVQGTGASNNGSFTSSDMKDYYATGQVVSGTLSASYVQGTSFNGSANEGSNGTVTFTGGPLQGSTYSYNTAAKLSDITGTWAMTTMQGETVSFTAQSNGSFSASSSGCTFSGNITPRATGKNVFDVTLQFGASPCALPNQTASGMAVSFITTSGARELIIAGTNASRVNGTAMFGMR